MGTSIGRLSETEGYTGMQANDRTVGRILLDAGKLKPGDAERALRLAKEKSLRFGEACVKLNLVSQGDVDAALSQQFDYPYLRLGEADLSEELVAAYHPFSAQVEELRALRTQLLLRWFSAERRVLAIVSPSRGEGRSYLAANLAVVFSQLGERTLLIDADMRAGRQHSMFKISNQYGLSALLSGRMSGAPVERIGHFSNLSVLPAGAIPPNPLELVSRNEFREVVTSQASDYDVVLIDTPAASISADAQAIAACTGGALVIAREDRSRIEALAQLTSALQSTHTEVVGCVLNRF